MDQKMLSECVGGHLQKDISENTSGAWGRVSGG